MAQRPAGADLTGEDRLHNLFKYLTARQNPDDPVLPVPGELREWARSTSQMALVGVCLGVISQWRWEREAGPIEAPLNAPSPAHAARWIAEAKTQRLIRLCNRATSMGLRVGAVSAVYFTAELLLRVYDGEARPAQAAWAGATAGGAFGLVSNLGLPAGVPGTRLIGAGLMGALGAGAGWCVGWTDRSAQSMLPAEVRQQKEAQWQQMMDICAGKDMTPVLPAHPASDEVDVTAAVIAALEAKLPNRSQDEAVARVPSDTETLEDSQSSVPQKRKSWWKPW